MFSAIFGAIFRAIFAVFLDTIVHLYTEHLWAILCQSGHTKKLKFKFDAELSIRKLSMFQ